MHDTNVRAIPMQQLDTVQGALVRQRVGTIFIWAPFEPQELGAVGTAVAALDVAEVIHELDRRDRPVNEEVYERRAIANSPDMVNHFCDNGNNKRKCNTTSGQNQRGAAAAWIPASKRAKRKLVTRGGIGKQRSGVSGVRVARESGNFWARRVLGHEHIGSWRLHTSSWQGAAQVLTKHARGVKLSQQPISETTSPSY